MDGRDIGWWVGEGTCCSRLCRDRCLILHQVWAAGLLQQGLPGARPQGRGQPAAAGDASFSQAPLLGGISRASLHLRQLTAALSNFIHHGPFYIPLFSLWTPTLGQDWEMEQSGSQKTKPQVPFHGSFQLRRHFLRAAWRHGGLQGHGQDGGRAWQRFGGCIEHQAVVAGPPSQLRSPRLEGTASRPLD